MRGVIVSGILFAVAVFFCIYSGISLEKVGKETCYILKEIKGDVEGKNWDDASEKVLQLQNEWKKDVKWITVLIDHRETDEINQTLSSLKEYIEYREVPELMATAGMLMEMFEHIPLKERLILENVF